MKSFTLTKHGILVEYENRQMCLTFDDLEKMAELAWSSQSIARRQRRLEAASRGSRFDVI